MFSQRLSLGDYRLLDTCYYQEFGPMSDWEERQKQDIALGKVCRTCGKYYPKMFNSCNSLYPGYPVNCSACDGIHSNAELSHHKYVRCPQCGHTCDGFECLGERGMEKIWCGDEIEVWCDECDHKFKVQTRYEVTFISPAIDVQPVPDDDE